MTTQPSSNKQTLPKIAILALGGTIASTTEPRISEFYSKASIPIADLIAALPELNTIANIQCEQFSQVLSHYLTDDIWLALARKVQSLLDNDVDGVVITHGTYTMEETAYFLNLSVKSTKPIVLTGAMYPANALGTDGLRNLFNAVTLAAHPSAAGKGVILTLNDEIYSARGAGKKQGNTMRGVSKETLLGYIQGSQPYFYSQPHRRHTLHSEFSIANLTTLPSVQIIYGHIGCDEKLVAALVAMNVAGIISAGMGKGHQSLATTQALAEARKKGVMVVRCARAGGLIVNRDPNMDDCYDFVAGDNLSPQKARILLALALTSTQDSSVIQRYFDTY